MDLVIVPGGPFDDTIDILRISSSGRGYSILQNAILIAFVDFAPNSPTSFSTWNLASSEVKMTW